MTDIPGVAGEPLTDEEVKAEIESLERLFDSTKTCQNTGPAPDPDKCSKYCIDHPWVGVCDECQQPVDMTYARQEALGSKHDGCFGYPACSCADPHTGDCEQFALKGSEFASAIDAAGRVDEFKPTILKVESLAQQLEPLLSDRARELMANAVKHLFTPYEIEFKKPDGSVVCTDHGTPIFLSTVCKDGEESAVALEYAACINGLAEAGFLAGALCPLSRIPLAYIPDTKDIAAIARGKIPYSSRWAVFCFPVVPVSKQEELTVKYGGSEEGEVGKEFVPPWA